MAQSILLAGDRVECVAGGCAARYRLLKSVVKRSVARDGSRAA
jgi:hypothetical protein